MNQRQVGFNLLEITITLAVIMLIVTMGVPPMFEWASGLRVEMAAAEIAGALHSARIYSARYGVKVAVKFRVEPDGVVTHGLYRDGDGDGVRNADIVSGTDVEERPPRRLAHFGRKIRFGFPVGKPPREPGNSGRRLDRLHDPIRFNRSDLASFNPAGTATPGTVYLTDGRRHLVAVRVNNRSGKIAILHYNQETELWR